jgi:predicted transcriptional regulator
VLSLTAQIVAAHVANNTIDPADLPKLINDVHRALANAGQSTTAPPRAEPAVDIKRSVRNDHIVCLECGKHFSMLKRHLNTDHQLTPQEYRQKCGLSPTYPVVAPDYAKIRAREEDWSWAQGGVTEEGWEEISPIASTCQRGRQEG